MTLKTEHLDKLAELNTDVDSVVYGFSSLSAYKPTMPFEVMVDGVCSPCRNVKLLDGIFKRNRKSMLRCCIVTEFGFFLNFKFFLDFNHVEFTLGGDPSLPIRVLVSFLKKDNISEYDSDSSAEEEVATLESGDVNWRKRFIESIFGPALARLSSKSLSRMKGAGNISSDKWHIHHSDWSKICFYVDQIAREDDTFGQYL
ncbi:LOW QUALITY PROTEIN: uncharacterized protein LOC132928447 [Rhopalosiphum padi]|uniref:LOW QUALITY PROTEIN: uncharacterized protein LOC132928447 n=1 Tax=Rhopalosiphum padi TaxID=40932 RepID=UPI00298EA9FE|nr:LOW QUALITY PROTEIN: uncharacterized protein LOC132928447 [Rhopalosiphum padi]